MGDNTLTTQSDGTVIDSSDINQYKTALVGDLLPRNASGAVEDGAGSIGSSSYKVKRANVEVGYFGPGNIIDHHTYNGVVPIPAGWYPCDNTIINEANYNSVHGAGKWASDIVSSLLDGLYAPDLVGNYTVGAATTVQSGSTALTTVGNSGNQIDIAHTHTQPSHVHRWYDDNGAATNAQSYESDGGAVDLTSSSPSTAGVQIASTAGSGDYLSADYYTDSQNPAIGSSLSATQSIQPESIEVIKIIRII